MSPARRLALSLAVAAGAALAVAPAAAAAQDEQPGERGLFRHMSCNERHWSTVVDTRSFGTHHPIGMRIGVRHEPGRFGLLRISDDKTGEEIWSFRQSYAWIWGSYDIISPPLKPVPRARIDYWSDNLAQAPELCRATLSLARLGLDVPAKRR